MPQHAASVRLRLRTVLILAAALLLGLGVGAYALTTTLALNGGDNAKVTCNGSSLSRSPTNKTTWTVYCKGTATATTTTPPPTTTTASSTTPPPTTTSPAPTTTPPPPPPSGLAVSVSGNHLIDGAGNPLQLRGVNRS